MTSAESLGFSTPSPLYLLLVEPISADHLSTWANIPIFPYLAVSQCIVYPWKCRHLLFANFWLVRFEFLHVYLHFEDISTWCANLAIQELLVVPNSELLLHNEKASLSLYRQQLAIHNMCGAKSMAANQIFHSEHRIFTRSNFHCQCGIRAK